MYHQKLSPRRCTLLLTTLLTPFLLSRYVHAEREIRQVNRTINKIGLFNESLIIVGEGFVASIPTNEFKKPITWIVEENTHNYSILAIKENSFFRTCYSDTSQARCSECSNHACQAKTLSFPKYILNGFEFWRETIFTIITSCGGLDSSNKEYVSQWLDPSTNIYVNVSVKGNWRYEVKNAYNTRSRQVYILSEAKNDGGRYKYIAMTRVDGRVFKETFVASTCGYPLLAVGLIKEGQENGIFFVGNQKRLCFVVWKFSDFQVEELSVRFNAHNAERKSGLRKPTSKLQPIEVEGFQNALWSNESVSSGLAIDENAKTTSRLLFLATQQGRILKFAITPADNGMRISLKHMVMISKKPARILLRDSDDEFLYGYIKQSDGKNEVFKMEIHDCGQHKDCSSCFTGDPYCRWFTLEQRCRFGKAEEANQVKNATLCPKIQSSSPTALPVERSIPVQVRLARIDVNGFKDRNAVCQWFLLNESRQTTAKGKSQDTVECSSPNFNISSKREYLEVNVSVLLDGSSVVDKKLTIKFYNCRHFRSCLSCQMTHILEGTNYNCSWQAKQQQCILEKSNIKKYLCPTLESGQKLKIPNKKPSNITLRGERLDKLGSGLKCNIDSRQFDFAILNRTKAYCIISETDFGVADDKFQKNATLRITTKENATIDTKDRKPLTVTIYECANIDSCSTCLIRGEGGYNCYATEKEHWKCKTGRVDGGQKPFNCGRKPEVTSIEPNDGPLEGGTLIKVNGDSLGLNKAQLSGKVTLAGVQCTVITVTKPLKSFICKTQPSTTVSSGEMRIWNEEAASSIHFFYKNFSSPYNIRPNFCFTDFPTHFNVIIQNFYIGRKRSITVDGIDLTSQIKNLSSQITNPLSQTDRIQIKCPSGVKSRSGKVEVNVDGNKKTSAKMFEFLQAPYLQIDKGRTFESIESGGVMLKFPSRNANLLTSVTLSIRSIRVTCKMTKDDALCRSPPGKKNNESESIELRTDPYVNFTRGKQLVLKFVTNPKFEVLNDETLTINSKNEIFLKAAKGSDLTLGTHIFDYKVMLGNKQCDVTALDTVLLTCCVNLSLEERAQKTRIKVFVGTTLNYTLGMVLFKNTEETWKTTVLVLLGMVIFILLMSFLGGCFYKKWRDKKQEEDRKERERYMEEEHIAAANASRNAFIEMQTAMEGMQLLDNNAELPYREFEDFIVGVLLPNPSGKMAALAELENFTKMTTKTVPSREMVTRFNSQLLSEKPFILTLIRTFDNSTKLADKSLIAAAISIVLSDRMEYYYEVLRELLFHIVKTNVAERRTDSLTLLFRRSESLMEKMFSNWLTMCFYNHLRTSDTGRKLYIVFKALTKFLHMGPVDACRFRARNVLSEEVLLSEEIDFMSIVIKGSIMDDEIEFQTAEVQVLSCDTIGQVKEKIIEALYPQRPFSRRPAAEDYVLQWKRNTGADGANTFYLTIETQVMPQTHSNKLPVIGDFNVKDALADAHLVLVRLNQAGKLNNATSLSSFVSEVDDCTNLLSGDSSGELYHLCPANTVANPTTISKDFCLPHLLKTRHVVHTYIEDLFKSILSIDQVEPPPPYVERMFSLIEEVSTNMPHDREMVAHVWKSNSYILRVWVNLLKNPEFLFDVNKSPIVNSSLSVIAQALMDACSYNPKQTSPKGLSSTKLVFLRDIQQYRKWVVEFYAKLEAKKNLPSDQDMSMLYNSMQNICNFSEDIIYRATRFLFMKSRDLKPKILDSIDHSQWFHTNDERQNFKDRVEAILGSTCSDTLV